jgi:hypothetical protein
MGALGRSGGALLAAMLGAFATMDDLELFAALHLSLNINEFTDRRKDIATLRLVQWAEQHGCESDLLAALRTARGGNPILMAAVDACERALNLTESISEEAIAEEAKPDPVQTCILRGRAPLFNRGKLRTHVAELLSNEGHNVLVVQGRSGSGRSHSLQFIVHVRAHLETFLLVPVDLEQYPVDAEPRDIVADMTDQLGVKLNVTAPDGQAARSNRSLVSTFVNCVEGQELPVWVVVDGYDHMKARREIVELMAELADRAERTCLKLRVILLGWDERLPPKLAVHVLHEEIEPITREVLEEFFTVYLRHQKQPRSPEGVRRAVELVEERAGNDFAENLGEISDAAFMITKTMAEPPRAA